MGDDEKRDRKTAKKTRDSSHALHMEKEVKGEETSAEIAASKNVKKGAFKKISFFSESRQCNFEVIIDDSADEEEGEEEEEAREIVEEALKAVKSSTGAV